MFKHSAEDFRVRETLAFEPSGGGEHLYLRLQKTDITTPFLAEEIARGFGVPSVAVGYAGMKDKRSVTEQWFSVATTADAGALPDMDGVRLLDASRHCRKLRKGQLARNRFDIYLRDVGDGEGSDRDWEGRLKRIAVQGAPNYFGPQRFGGDNLAAARAWLPVRRQRRVSRFTRGLYLSVLRSYLFNEVLGKRVAARCWNRLLPGDVLDPATADETPTGPLWGRGRSAAADAAAEFESTALAMHHELLELLEHAGLTQDRRSLVLRPEEMVWQPRDGGVEVSFTLPPGGYATTVLREVFELVQPDGGST